MSRLGIDEEKIKTVGNLKLVMPLGAAPFPPDERAMLRSPEHVILLCGSTHPGEEEVLFTAFSHLRKEHPNLLLILAPRDIKRSADLAKLAGSHGFLSRFFSDRPSRPSDVLIVDTIGDLAKLYSLADIAFIGGSLVPAGGHNPLEAARQGCPILFGPHMEDFSEIRSQLLEQAAAFEVSDLNSIINCLADLITLKNKRQIAGHNAQSFVEAHRSILADHIAIIQKYL